MIFAPFYAVGAAMGWPPSAVSAASLWQFQAASVGWGEANGRHRELDADDLAGLSSMLDDV